MRKSFICFLLLVLLAVGVMAASVQALDDQKDNISVVEETVYGDAKAVENLAVTTHALLSQQLYWDTSYLAGENPETATEFRFYPERQSYENESDGYFYLQLGSSNFGMGSSHHIDLEAIEYNRRDDHRDMREGLNHMLLPAIDVASRTANGQEHKETVRLRDYYERYKIQPEYNLTGMDMFDEASYQTVAEALAEVLVIPVPEDLMVEVIITKDDMGQVTDVECWDVVELGHVYDCWSEGLVMEDGVYFYLGGNLDFSQIKLGYGIYWIPIVQTVNGKAFLDVENMENIYDLELPSDGEGRARMQESSDGTQVYLFEKRGEDWQLVILDHAAKTVVQQLPLCGSPTVWHGENAEAFLTSEEVEGEESQYHLQVYEKQGDKLALWLDTDLPQVEKEWFWSIYRQPTVLFNGETLAVGSFYDNYYNVSTKLLLFDRSGLQYAGIYHNAMDELATNPISEGLELKWMEE